MLQPLGERGFAAADRAEQIEDLLALLEPLRGVLEEADDALDRVLHAEEAGHRGIELDRAIEEDAPEALILAGVDDGRLADRRDHALGGRRIHRGIVAAGLEIVGQPRRFFPLAGISLREETEHIRAFGASGRFRFESI